MPWNAVAEFARYWTGCNQVVSIGADGGNPSDVNQALATAIPGAIAAWNAALQHPMVSAAPQIRYEPSGANADVTVRLDGLGASYCGNNLYGSGTPPTPPYGVELRVKSSSNCGSNWSTLPRVLAHEFGHVLGFSFAAHSSGYAVAAHCAMELALVEPAINSGVCQHEVEKIYAAYGIVPLSGITPFFYSLPIVTGVNAPASVSLQVGASTAITPTQLLFARGGVQGSVSLGSVQLNWASSRPLVASVDGGMITGLNRDTATITITANPSTIPSQYQMGGLFRQFGQAITVTVVDPPLGPGFAVSDIYGVPQPVTATGDYTFQVSTVNGGAPSTLQVDWTIAPSIPVFDTVRTGWGPRTLMIHVYAGSYNIRVTAQPRNRATSSDPWVIGGAMIEDFPVCTGGGGQYLMAPEPGPDAVGGC